MNGGGPGSGIWKSTDGGETWTRLKTGLPEGSLGRIGARRLSQAVRTFSTRSIEGPAAGRGRAGGGGWRCGGGRGAVAVAVLAAGAAPAGAAAPATEEAPAQRRRGAAAAAAASRPA